MLRTSTIIVIIKIMVEVLKMSMLFWFLRAAARMVISEEADRQYQRGCELLEF
jgi:hypothetical protein